MKVLGLLGGMSWESSVEYYRLANEETRSRLGGLHSAPLLLWSVDFAEIEALQAAGSWDEAGARLARAARALEGAGAEILVLCTNTMHKVADTIEAAVTIPLVHIVDSVAAAVSAAGMRRVGLLGTRFSMEEPFWADRMAGHGLDVLVPEPEDRETVHRIIYEELCLGVFGEASRASYVEIIERLISLGAEGVVLGCTEIELLVRPGDTRVPVFPSTAIHVRSAVEAALAEQPQSEQKRRTTVDRAEPGRSGVDPRLCPGSGTTSASIHQSLGSASAKWGHCPFCKGSYRVDKKGLLVEHKPPG